MRLVREWRRCWRMFSVQSMAVSTALLATWGLLPENLVSAIPAPVVTGVAVVILVLGMIGRLIDQPKVKEGQK